MKKFEIIVTTKQGEKKVSVYVENETAEILKTCPEEWKVSVQIRFWVR